MENAENQMLLQNFHW